jgi:hypothetical protein
MTVNRPAADEARANQETPMKSLTIATVSALALALVTPAVACPGAKNMQNADAGTAQSEKPAEAAAAQTPMPAADATAEAQPAEVAAAPEAEAPTTKN